MEDTNIQWNALLAVLREFGQAVTQQMINNLGQDGSNASRTLTNSITYDYGIDDGHYWVDVELEDYYKYVNDGRPAGKMPPIEKIEDWIRVKPVQPRPYVYTPSVETLAFLIQRSIKQKKGYAPPSDAIRKWMDKKGIRPEPREVTPSVRSLAYLIARKIGRDGTTGTKFFDRAVESAKPVYEDRIQTAIADDIQYWLEDIVAESLRNLKI